MRALFAWELGGNLGHLSKDIALALQLRGTGHEVEFVCHDLNVASRLLTSHGFPFREIPAFPPSRGAILRRKMSTHGEILRTLWGDSSVPVLRHLVAAWVDLLEARRVDAIVSDYAPSSIVGAIAADVPVALVGTGWEIPPIVSPLPWMSEESPPASRAIETQEIQLLDCINYVLHIFGRRPLETVSHLYAARPTFLTTFPELDHYWPRSNATYIGDIGASAPHKAVAWSESNSRKVLAYLRQTTPGIENILLALAEVDAEVICICPDIGDVLVEQVQDRITIVRESVNLQNLLPECTAVVCYGGAGFVATALRNGVPILLVSPQWNERKRTARRAVEIGAATWIDEPADKTKYIRCLSELLDGGGDAREHAKSFRDRYSSIEVGGCIELTAAAVARLA